MKPTRMLRKLARSSKERRGFQLPNGSLGQHLSACKMVREITHPTVLKDAGKPIKLALTACAIKLLIILNAMEKSGQNDRKQQG